MDFSPPFSSSLMVEHWEDIEGVLIGVKCLHVAALQMTHVHGGAGN